MKKVTLVLAMLIMADLTMAQNYDLLESLSAGDYWHCFSNVMQMDDESILANIKLFTFDGETQHSHGWCFFKVSRDCSEVFDTVMIEDHTTSPTGELQITALLEPDPDGDGYLFARIKRDEILPKNHLSICRFDEELVFDLENEIRVPLEDSVSIGFEYLYLDDNDIILYYPMIGPNREFVLSRFGTDGNLKHRQVIADTLCPINQPLGKIKVWNESPKKYVVNGRQLVPIGGGISEVFTRFGVLDSLFSIEELMEYNVPLLGSGAPLGTEVSSDYLDDFLSLDDSTYVFTSCCYHMNNNNAKGVHVTRRDKRTHHDLKTVVFPNNDPISVDYTCHTIGVQKSSDGCLYVAFFNNGIVITKTDMELNVLWQRRCLSTTQYNMTVSAYASAMQTLYDGGLAVGGYYHLYRDRVFVLALSRDGTGIPEAEAFIRPYLFYPNPAQDQLHPQYSPDVTPAQIELYDIQGRLILTQRKDLESMDLQGLTAGQYLMKVTLENGKVFTDKIVKE